MLNPRKLVFILAASALATSLTAADPDTKIDRGLIDTITDSDSGTAGFFVMFADRAPLTTASSITDWNARGKFVVDTLQATASRSQNGVLGYLQGHKVNYKAFWVVNAIYIPTGTLDLARDLAKRNEVAAIVPEKTYAVPPVGGGGTQAVGWNLSLIGADQVWSAYSNRGTGMVVANIDTGVQFDHPALVKQYRGNLGGGSFSHPNNWYDPANICGGAPCDNVGHGSHTMGTMVGDDGLGNQVGVAPGAKWIACKGCESNNCSGTSLISCAQWILAPGGNSNLRPNVVNNSWGGGSGSNWYQSYVQSWVAAGIFPAFSAGNSGSACSTANDPGDYPQSFASGATDSGDNIASFSSRGPSLFGGVKPNVSAPGVSIYSSVPTNGYAYYSGTSMASPHTAGSVALLWAIRSNLVGNISATETLLDNNAAVRTTTETCGGLAAGANPNNTYGYGRIDIKSTVDAAGGPVNQPPTVTIGTPATDGQQFNCGVPVTFAATASDPESGSLTSSIQWSGPGMPATATGGNITKTFSCSNELGNRTVAAKITDNGGLSATDTVIVNIVNPNSPPAAPSGLGYSISGTSVLLHWTDNSTNETGFNIYRRSKTKNKWGAWSKVGNVLSPATTFTNLNVASGSYQYYVTAYNTAGQSAPSTSISVNK